MSAVIPKNCTLGTEYYCVGFGDHAKCKGLPLQVSGVLAAAFTGDQAQSLHPLDRALARIIFRSIEGCLIFGFIFAILAFVLGLIVWLTYPTVNEP